MEIKPKAMAMPMDTSALPQGKYGPIQSPPPVTDLRSSRRSSLAVSRSFTNTRRTSRRLWLEHPISWRRLSCITCGGCCFQLEAKPTSCTRASSIPTLTSTPRMRWPCSALPVSGQSLKTSRASRWTGKPIRKPSLSLFAITSARALWSTQSIHISARTKSRRL